jgi:hypothetical protein
MARSRQHFGEGGCYVCVSCGKKTRATGRGDNEHVRQCARCYDMGGDENAVQDGMMTVEEFVALWGQEPEGDDR